MTTSSTRRVLKFYISREEKKQARYVTGVISTQNLPGVVPAPRATSSVPGREMPEPVTRCGNDMDFNFLTQTDRYVIGGKATEQVKPYISMKWIIDFLSTGVTFNYIGSNQL